MIALVVAAWAGSAGLQGGVLAFKGPGRHDLAPTAGAWLRMDREPWSLTVDAFGSARGSADGIFAHRTAQSRLAVVVGPGAGGERAHTGIGVGPAVVVRQGTVGSRTFVDLAPGVRALAHLDVRIGPLALRTQTGFVFRGLRKVDVDVGLGLGAWW